MSVGIEAGGLSSVPSGDDLESSLPQNLACCLSSVGLLWDMSQQYSDKWSRPQKATPFKSGPQKSPASWWAEWEKHTLLCVVEGCFLKGQISGTTYLTF